MLFPLSYVHSLCLFSCEVAPPHIGPTPDMQKGRSTRLRVLGPCDPWTSASAGAARYVPVHGGPYMADSSWLGSH